MTKNSSMELVLIPTPGMGHLLSSVEVAKRILHRDPRISIFIPIIDLPNSSSSMVTSFLESQSKDNPYPTRLEFLTLPPPQNPPTSSSFSSFRTIIELYKPLVKQAIEDRVRDRVGSSTLSGFILDMFCTSMMDIALEFNVPWYVFFTSGASLLNLLFHLQTLADDQRVDIVTELSDPDKEIEVPGFANRLGTKNLPPVVADTATGGSEMMLNLARGLKKSKGIIVNTYMELETCGLEALMYQACEGSVPRVYPVGPILELDNKSRSGSQGEDERSIIEWLNNQPSSSVVFLCFGSRGSFDADQVKEVAKGLEKTKHRFLWSLRRPPLEGTFAMPSVNETFLEALPEGFLERTAHLGKIISWAPQVSILSHRAIGGFVSHCGWNSTLESMWFGVPMATWPLQAEQQLNAFVLVKELRVAVEIRMDYRLDWTTKKPNFQVSAEEIENGVNKLMGLDDETKKIVREMGEKSRKTLEEGGSSYEWLGRFIEDVSSSVC